MGKLAAAVTVTVIAGAALGFGLEYKYAAHTPQAATGTTTARPPAAAPSPLPDPVPAPTLPSHDAGRYLGVVTTDLPAFDHTTRTRPDLAVRYYDWGNSFPAATIADDARHGAELLIVLEPHHVSLRGVADGTEDGFLAQWAAADRQLGLPVMLSFAPEANGDWYEWGAGHITPALYKAMWRHVHDTLLRDGARHVTWLWQVSVPFRGSEPIQSLWPGPKYANMAGIDGQLTTPGDTFSSMFGVTIGQAQAITGEPVMISEVAVNRGRARPQQITGLFNGVKHDGLAGLVWFDLNHGGITDYRLAKDPAALTAYRKAAKSFK